MTQQNALTDYLERVATRHPEDSALLDSIAPRHMGNHDPLAALYVRKTLIAAVARAFQPGCYMHTLLVLQGAQGTGKSEWFRRLMPQKDWFDEGLSVYLTPRDQRRLQQAWFAGWNDFCNLIMTADEHQLKDWLSITIDRTATRPGNPVDEVPRRCILVSSTNTKKLPLTPAERRYIWVVPVQRPILLEVAEAERDHIWAAAYHAYKAGEVWHITDADIEIISTAEALLPEGMA